MQVTVDDIDQESIAGWRPRLRDMSDVLLGPRQPLRRTSAVRALPEDGRVALTIGLKRDTRAVGRPDRVPVLAAERQLTARARAARRVDPDVGRLLIVG